MLFVICARLSISSEPLTWSATSLRKRCSTSFAGRGRDGSRARRPPASIRERLVEIALDVLAGDRHRDVPLAGAAVVDLDVQLQLGLFFFALFARTA